MPEGIGHCVRCRAKRAMVRAIVERSARHGWVLRGTCPVCGTTMWMQCPAQKPASLRRSNGSHRREEGE